MGYAGGNHGKVTKADNYEGTAGPVLATNSKKLQEACHGDSQLNDKRTAVDTV